MLRSLECSDNSRHGRHMGHCATSALEDRNFVFHFRVCVNPIICICTTLPCMRSMIIKLYSILFWKGKGGIKISGMQRWVEDPCPMAWFIIPLLFEIREAKLFCFFNIYIYIYIYFPVNFLSPLDSCSFLWHISLPSCSRPRGAGHRWRTWSCCDGSSWKKERNPI